MLGAVYFVCLDTYIRVARADLCRRPAMMLPRLVHVSALPLCGSKGPPRMPISQGDYTKTVAIGRRLQLSRTDVACINLELQATPSFHTFLNLFASNSIPTPISSDAFSVPT
jgi:hypothetical protein